MSSLISKRQQARNEKALQDLVHSVPGNNFCADCQARNPSWASWNLGIFLCIRCAAIHRKLGTHISKVKSLSMDSWTNDQVEIMKKNGNVKSNNEYNPQNKIATLPLDADEVDGAMERFVRKKYTTRQLRDGSGNTIPPRATSTVDSDDESSRPKPPPKPASTSSSSSFSLSLRGKKDSAARSGLSNIYTTTTPPSPQVPNKPSKVFGVTVEYDSNEDTERKLSKLRDMGFGDHQRNAMVLKGVSGNLDRAIEALVRLGDGDGRSPTSLKSPSLGIARSLTPVSPTGAAFPTTSSSSSSPYAQHSAVQPHSHDGPATPSTIASNNPFDMFPPQPQSSQSTGAMHNRNPYLTTQHAVTQNELMNQAFRNLSLAPGASSQQPLFPHHTGNFPVPQPAPQPHPIQQSMTPPASYQPFMPQFSSNLFPAQHGLQQQQQQQQQSQPQNLALNTTFNNGTYGGSNPFAKSPARMSSPNHLGQIPEQSQAGYTNQHQLVQQYGMMQQQPAMNPYDNMHQNQHYGVTQMASPGYTAAQRPDKASILALYNYPHLAPQAQPGQEKFSHAPVPVPAAAQQPRSVSMPMPGSNNPFLSSVVAAEKMPSSPLSTNVISGMAQSAHVQEKRPRDSVALGLELAWSNGRHSPDAFASLSARHG